MASLQILNRLQRKEPSNEEDSTATSGSFDQCTDEQPVNSESSSERNNTVTEENTAARQFPSLQELVLSRRNSELGAHGISPANPSDGGDYDISSANANLEAHLEVQRGTSHVQASTPNSRPRNIDISGDTIIVESDSSEATSQATMAPFPIDISEVSFVDLKQAHDGKKMTILLVGNSSVGKSTFINWIRHNRFDKMEATLSVVPNMFGIRYHGQYFVLTLVDSYSWY